MHREYNVLVVLQVDTLEGCSNTRSAYQWLTLLATSIVKCPSSGIIILIYCINLK